MKKKTLSEKELGAAKRRMTVLERQLAGLGSVMRGNIVTNGKKHPQAYFSLNKDGKTRLIYLGEGRLPKAKKLSENYKRMVEITEEMTVINMDLLKNDAI
jgi:hypothetical protein